LTGLGNRRRLALKLQEVIPEATIEQPVFEDRECTAVPFAEPHHSRIGTTRGALGHAPRVGDRSIVAGRRTLLRSLDRFAFVFWCRLVLGQQVVLQFEPARASRANAGHRASVTAPKRAFAWALAAAHADARVRNRHRSG
jgi:hypothetical protein